MVCSIKDCRKKPSYGEIEKNLPTVLSMEIK